MLKTIGRVGVLSVAALMVAAGGADAAMPMSPSSALLSGEAQAVPVSFWAKPYPYGYTPWRRCPRVRVETPYGWSWERVCHPARGVVLQRAY